MSPTGVLTVAKLELMQRFRGARWYIAFGLWFLCVAGVAGLTWLALRNADFDKGSTTFDVVLFFVLGLSLLIMPALTATSVNGDRDAGVLATLQTTLLSASDIILGKLVASLVMAMTFLGLAAPFLVLALFQGGVNFFAALRVLLVMAVILLAVCAIGLMFSTLVARAVGSAVLTYLAVAGLSVLTLILFAMTTPLVATEETVRINGIQTYDGPSDTACEEFTDTRDVIHTERNWWLLAMNPFVIVADAAPNDLEGLAQGDATSAGFTPLRYISYGTRLAKAGPAEIHDECYTDEGSAADNRAVDEFPAWPAGLALYVLAGVGATLVAVRRVRTPIRRLPSGTRVA